MNNHQRLYRQLSLPKWTVFLKNCHNEQSHCEHHQLSINLLCLGGYSRPYNIKRGKTIPQGWGILARSYKRRQPTHSQRWHGIVGKFLRQLNTVKLHGKYSYSNKCSNHQTTIQNLYKISFQLL